MELQGFQPQHVHLARVVTRSSSENMTEGFLVCFCIRVLVFWLQTGPTFLFEVKNLLFWNPLRRTWDIQAGEGPLEEWSTSATWSCHFNSDSKLGRRQFGNRTVDRPYHGKWMQTGWVTKYDVQLLSRWSTNPLGHLLVWSAVGHRPRRWFDSHHDEYPCIYEPMVFKPMLIWRMVIRFTIFKPIILHGCEELIVCLLFISWPFAWTNIDWLVVMVTWTLNKQSLLFQQLLTNNYQ